MKWITEAKHIESYKIWLKFNDKTKGVVEKACHSYYNLIMEVKNGNL